MFIINLMESLIFRKKFDPKQYPNGIFRSRYSLFLCCKPSRSISLGSIGTCQKEDDPGDPKVHHDVALPYCIGQHVLQSPRPKHVLKGTNDIQIPVKIQRKFILDKIHQLLIKIITEVFPPTGNVKITLNWNSLTPKNWEHHYL